MQIAYSYILINTNQKKEYEVYNNLINHPSIIELNPLYNEFDMIAKIKTKNKDKMGGFITKNIRSLDGVIDTKIL